MIPIGYHPVPIAERGGFEPPIPFRGIHAFQACLFNHSSIFPFWFAAILFASAKVLFLSIKTNKYLNNLAFFIDYHFRVPLFIDTQQDPQMQLFSQLMEGTLKKLER